MMKTRLLFFAGLLAVATNSFSQNAKDNAVYNAPVVQEQKLNADFSYIQENAGTLLLSGLSTLLLPNTKAKSKEAENSQLAQTSDVPSMSLGLADYLSVAQGLLPVAWEVARPLLTAWGIQKVQAWIIKKLFKKKK